MKRVPLLCLFLFCTISILISCSSNERVEEKLSTAYSLLNTNPDSAISILSTIDRHSLHTPLSARYALLYSIAQDKSGVDVTDDSLLSIAKSYYDNKETDSLYAKFCYYQGLYYVLIDSLKLAEDYLWKSINSAEAQGDKYTAYLACFQMRGALMIRNPKKALVYAQKALELYESMNQNNISNQIYLIREVGTGYYMIGEKDSALVYMNKALHLAISSNNQELSGKTYHSISQIQLSMNRPDSALYYAKMAWNTSSERDPSLYSHMAGCYIRLDSLDQAEELLKTATKIPSSVYTKYNIYNRLLSINLSKHGNKNAEEYSDSVQALLKRLYYSSESDNASYQEDNHQLTTQKNEIEALFSKSLLISILVITLLIIIVLLVIYSFYISKKKANIKLNYERKQLEIEKMQFEIKGKQLALMKSFFLLKSDYEKQLNEYKTKLRTADLQEEDWLVIEIFLNENFSNFVILLRNTHPNLTENEVRDCMLLKIGLTNPEMERFYGISNPSVKQRLLRLKNKLGISEKSISTREYIQSLVTEVS